MAEAKEKKDTDKTTLRIALRSGELFNVPCTRKEATDAFKAWTSGGLEHDKSVGVLDAGHGNGNQVGVLDSQIDLMAIEEDE